jgi:hypothetical protein
LGREEIENSGAMSADMKNLMARYLRAIGGRPIYGAFDISTSLENDLLEQWERGYENSRSHFRFFLDVAQFGV